MLSLLSIVLAGVGAAGPSVELPNPSLDPAQGVSGWELGPGASLDRTAGAAAPGCLRLAVDRRASSASASTRPVTGLKPWHWHRLTFAYRLDPGVSAEVAWWETDGQGVSHRRSGRDRLRLAPAARFTPAGLEFLSRPDVAAFRLTFEARLIAPEARPGAFGIDDVRLEAIGPAEAAPAQRLAHAVLNHDFESLNLIGYYNTFGTATVAIVDDGAARSGGRVLRHTAASPRDGTHGYVPTRDDLELAYGHMYRVTAWARGPGSLDVGLATGDGWLLDRRQPPGPTTRPAEGLWRRVAAEFIIDRRSLRGVQVLLLPGGDVDIDDLQIERLR